MPKLERLDSVPEPGGFADAFVRLAKALTDASSDAYTAGIWGNSERQTVSAVLSVKAAGGSGVGVIAWAEAGTPEGAAEKALADYFRVCPDPRFRVPAALHASSVEELELKLALAGERGGPRGE